MSPAEICLVETLMGSFHCTSRAIICLVVRRAGNLYDMALAVIFLVVRRVGSFSYTPRVEICWGVSIVRPVPESVWSKSGWGVSLTCHVL